jgi:hypothetical protein
MPGDTPSVNLNTKGVEANHFEAIVIGSGINPSNWNCNQAKQGGILNIGFRLVRNWIFIL